MDESDDLKDFTAVTGYKPEELPADAPAEDHKKAASIQWLRLITELERVQREAAEISEDVSDGLRAADLREIQTAWGRVEDAMRHRVRCWQTEHEARNPAGHAAIRTMSETIERMLAGMDFATVWKSRAFDHITDTWDSWLAYMNAVEGLELQEAINACDELKARSEAIEAATGTPAEVLARLAVLMEYPPPPVDHGHTSHWHESRRWQSMTAEELQAALVEKQAEVKRLEQSLAGHEAELAAYGD